MRRVLRGVAMVGVLTLSVGAGVAHAGAGKKKGMDGTGVDVSFNCFGVADSVGDAGSPLSYVADAVEIQHGSASVFLEGSASAALPGDGLTSPLHGASASLGTPSLALQPSDFCDTSAGSVLASVVTGSHLLDPTATGWADVEFHVHYDAILHSEGTGGIFTAYTGTELAVLGVSFDSFEVTASGDIVSAPPGFSVTESIIDGARVSVISGLLVIPGQLAFGKGATNTIESTFFAGGFLESVSTDGATIVAGVAAAEALDTISYEIKSLDPNVVFAFEEVPDPNAEPAAE
ncbi:MAG: hypothetical protein ABFS41_00685 [Myxococcota bacterium]